ncbi:TadE-like protein [Stieleria maiorica]|uniref:TadE-like protein n=1 Tax=Stieleria maiorica TaxID=2795974 RepID=A0A5B9M6S1_9BACT|nr:TadE/TadG family type IV pilus assembly protein [Stieleria maiorica]QEF96812.1 TadE-like protein [Stieleria maiorica]
MFLSKRRNENSCRSRRRRQRRGAATVEFAICLPALIALTIGTIDLCSMLFLKESITLAAYEGARRGVARGRTNADVIARVQEFLDERNIQYSGNPCTFSSPDFTDADTLENVTTTVTVPCDGNLLIPSVLFAGIELSAEVTLRKEYKNLPIN